MGGPGSGPRPGQRNRAGTGVKKVVNRSQRTYKKLANSSRNKLSGISYKGKGRLRWTEKEVPWTAREKRGFKAIKGLHEKGDTTRIKVHSSRKLAGRGKRIK